jgi:spore coat polysaccharide biosynthesis predicted glycosyltransferase SpsG
MSERPLRVLYRADGGHPIGTGHIWRAARIMKELAGRVELDARILFAEDPFARRVAEAMPARAVALPPRCDVTAVKPVLSAGPLLAEIEREPADVIAVDMLDTPEPDMVALRATGIPLVTFDDRGEGRRHADTIIDVLIEEPAEDSLPRSTRILEGGDYVVLDPVFETAHSGSPRREFGSLRRVFVAMGGADAAGLSMKVARALRLVEGLEEVQFVCGPAFPHHEELRRVTDGAPWQCELLDHLPGLLDRYRWCDLAIVAGGLTMYEVCCTGTPSLAVCQPIDHQLELADRLSAVGAMATVGYGLEASVEQIAAAVRQLADPEARRKLSDAGPALVDGKGTARVADAILDAARWRQGRRKGSVKHWIPETGG